MDRKATAVETRVSVECDNLVFTLFGENRAGPSLLVSAHYDSAYMLLPIITVDLTYMGIYSMLKLYTFVYYTNIK